MILVTTKSDSKRIIELSNSHVNTYSSFLIVQKERKYKTFNNEKRICNDEKKPYIGEISYSIKHIKRVRNPNPTKSSNTGHQSTT